MFTRTMMRTVMESWDLALYAVAVGVVIAFVILAVYYLAPLVRLRWASDHEGRQRVLEKERERQRRLENTVAVYDEHDRRDAGELGADTRLRSLILRTMERRVAERQTEKK